jgi:hypothetical protein
VYRFPFIAAKEEAVKDIAGTLTSAYGVIVPGIKPVLVPPAVENAVG